MHSFFLCYSCQESRDVELDGWHDDEIGNICHLCYTRKDKDDPNRLKVLKDVYETLS